MPKPPSELRSGVGLVHSTDDAVEGNETRRGKEPARGDPLRGRPCPDTEPGRTAFSPCTGEHGGPRGCPDPLHRPAASRRCRGTRESVPASEAAGKRGSRWDHGGRLRAEPGGQPSGPLCTGPHRALPATTGPARLYPESRWRTASARRPDPGRQDRPGRGRRDAERHLRSRLPRVLLPAPAGRPDGDQRTKMPTAGSCARPTRPLSVLLGGSGGGSSPRNSTALEETRRARSRGATRSARRRSTRTPTTGAARTARTVSTPTVSTPGARTLGLADRGRVQGRAVGVDRAHGLDLGAHRRTCGQAVRVRGLRTGHDGPGEAFRIGDQDLGPGHRLDLARQSWPVSDQAGAGGSTRRASCSGRRRRRSGRRRRRSRGGSGGRCGGGNGTGHRPTPRPRPARRRRSTGPGDANGASQDQGK